MDMVDPNEPNSPIEKISKIAPDSDDDGQPLKNQNREGVISKPRAKRTSLPDVQ